MAERINKKMSFAEIMEKNPNAAEILFKNGMHCIGCAMAMSETLEEGAIAHGLNPDKIVKELNETKKIKIK
jgi:hybrid cluster-associated redox disulfide protein